MLMHVDGNSFYASCERLFRPDLAHKPIVVLTNNDGILIALNAECKALGFKRGDVYYENREKLKKAGVAVFSSNYTLYNDISCRLNALYGRYAPEVETYSIDESFLYFPDWKNTSYTEIGREIRNAAMREIGIPVSVGIAPDKTLAKMCNKLAKKYGGVCSWDEIDQDDALAACPVADVWGVGWAKAKFLENRGVHSALDLKNYPLDKAKKNLSITGYRTVRELNGVKCIEQSEKKDRQSIIVSRSFSAAVFDLPTINAALSQYAQEASKRLREEKLAAKDVSVWLLTNACSKGPQYFNSASARLPEETSFFPDIVKCASKLLESIFRPGYRYRKVMLGLFGLAAEKNIGRSLFAEENENRDKKERLSQCFDAINSRYGRNVLRLGLNDATADGADTGCSAAWQMKREMLSPRYTTCPDDFPEAR
jgi:DNA polymerase V